MRREILITLPRHDDVTEYLSQFSQQIEESANEKGIKIKKLKDKNANQKEFEKIQGIVITIRNDPKAMEQAQKLIVNCS